MIARGLPAVFALAAGCSDSPRCTDGATWSSAPPVPGGGVQETGVVALDGKIYVIGGFNSAMEDLADVRVFDPSTQTWSAGPPLPRALNHVNAGVVGETIYVLGALETTSFIPVGDAFAWSPATDANWTTRASMPAGTERGAAVVGAIEDVIYVAGGLASVDVASVLAYSTTTDTWSDAVPPLPMPFDHGCGGVVDGTLYALGGRYMGNSPLVFAYTPGGMWVEKTRMPTARSGIACGICDGQIIVAGGELNPANEASVFETVEVYTVDTDSWSALPPLPTPRHGTGGAVVDGAFYMAGGATRTGYAAVDTNEVLKH